MKNTSMANDVNMEKLLVELKQFKDDKQRLIATCEEMVKNYQEKIEFYKAQIDVKETSVKEQLFGMIEIDKMKPTKTEQNYRLPSGKLFIKKESQSMKLKPEYNEADIPERFLKVERSVKWGDFKKILKIEGDCVINTQTGEIIDSVEIETKPAGQLDIKLD